MAHRSSHHGHHKSISNTIDVAELRHCNAVAERASAAVSALSVDDDSIANVYAEGRLFDAMGTDSDDECVEGQVTITSLVVDVDLGQLYRMCQRHGHQNKDKQACKALPRNPWHRVRVRACMCARARACAVCPLYMCVRVCVRALCAQSRCLRSREPVVAVPGAGPGRSRVRPTELHRQPTRGGNHQAPRQHAVLGRRDAPALSRDPYQEVPH